jgi:Ca2+-binding RTX toxin-like protein
MGRWKLGVACVALALLLIVPVAASASGRMRIGIGQGKRGDTVERDYRAERGTFQILFLTGTSGHDHMAVKLSESRKRFLIRTNRRVQLGGGCRRKSKHVINCRASGVRGLAFAVGPARDDVTVARNIERYSAADLGAGGDRFNGGGGNDLTVGGAGNDTMRSNGDKDGLVGGKGRDRLFGGAGDDYIRGGKDRDRIKGGPGTDNTRQ